MAQRFEGHNIEDALQSAAQAFGVERYQLTYHVVLEKRGFLGGVKRVVVEAEVNTDASEPAAEPVRAHDERQPRSERRPRGGRGRGSERGERGQAGNRGRRGGRAERSERTERPRRDPVFVSDPAPEQGPESEAAVAVRRWCEEALHLARLDAEIRTTENDDQIVIRLYGRDSGRLIDRNGELLDALQVLANKALVGRNIEKDIELDCAEFKERRIEELGERARATADRVRRDGREQLLPAMTPVERRIIHLALQDDPEVTTESRGDGFYKRVAVIPRPPQPSQPES